ncbi:MAG: acyl-ACP thioesterase domain-containing protein [Actinomycetota bacterium]
MLDSTASRSGAALATGRPLERSGRLILALLGPIPVTLVGLSTIGWLTFKQLATLAVPLGFVVLGIVVAARPLARALASEALLAGLVATFLYDLLRWGFLAVELMARDPIPHLGSGLDLEPGWLFGYLWRFIGNGGGLALCFFALGGRGARLGAAYGLAVCSGLLAFLIAAPNGQSDLFPLDGATLFVAVAGHLIYGITLGLLADRSPARAEAMAGARPLWSVPASVRFWARRLAADRSGGTPNPDTVSTVSTAPETPVDRPEDGPGDQPEPLAPPAQSGRRFVGRRKVRLGDVDRSGRLRLDALTRYTQDVSDDDTTDAGLPPEPGWVVRSTVVDELIPATLAETMELTTFCSGVGNRWAERRLTIIGDHGGRYEVATLWVCIDAASGRPVRLSDRFLKLYGEAAAGRSVSARLQNPKLADADQPIMEERWPLRVSDYDIYDHVNNAAYWAVVEQWSPPTGRARRIRLEYGAGVAPDAAVTVARTGADADRAALWWLDGGDPTAPVLASAAVRPIPGGLYPGATGT